MKNSEAEAIEILLRNVINMHEKLNILIDYLAKDIEQDDKYEREFYKDEDMLVQIEKDTYKQMCDLMEDNTIPFMGIAQWRKMDILAVLEQFGIPVTMTIAFGFFIWRQNRFIQETLMTELDQDFQRLEGIIFKLIDQQKKVQMEQKKLNGIFKAQVEIIARLSGSGLNDNIFRIMEKGGMVDE